MLGDYNIDLFKNDPATNNFYYCLQSNYLLPTIQAATRVATNTLRNGNKKTSKTLIDNILIKANIMHNSGLIESSISDHYPIFISIPEIDKGDFENNIPQTIQYRLINHLNLRKFLLALTMSNIRSSLDCDIAQESFTKFNQMFNDLHEKYYPIKSKLLKGDLQPP